MTNVKAKQGESHPLQPGWNAGYGQCSGEGCRGRQETHAYRKGVDAMLRV
jgi:hypothetical protein